jgi:hypothetical protein
MHWCQEYASFVYPHQRLLYVLTFLIYQIIYNAHCFVDTCELFGVYRKIVRVHGQVVCAG